MKFGLGIRGRLFFVSLMAILAIAVSSGLYLEHQLRRRLERGVESELTKIAGLSRDLLQRSEVTKQRQDLDHIADRMGRSSGTRISIIDSDGNVLGDSELTLEELQTVKNHADRPEIRAAMTSGEGSSRRFSTTLQRDMLYVAVRFQRPHGCGVVRAAMSLSEVDESISQLRLLLVVAGLLGLGVALLVGGLASHFTTRRLRLLVDHARMIASGNGHRLDETSRDELSRIAGSFNKMAIELDGTVESLARERNRLETILESMSDAVLAVDRDHKVTLINAAALRQLGLSEPPIGQPLVVTVKETKLVNLVIEVSTSNLGAEDELELQSDQSPRIVLARAQPLRFPGGAVVVMHDVSEMRRLERVRRDFVANVSHELRTPVSVVRANAETLLDGALDDRELAENFLEAILRNANRLSRIITDLLDLSRIEAGSYSLKLQPTRLAASIRRAIESVEKVANANDLKIINEIPPGIEAHADPAALDHVMQNLVDNAAKYTPNGGHITIRSSYEPRKIRIEVCDDGPGVKAKYRERIFERFYRVDKGRSREMGGTGLGLSITKHLVENMNGEIGVEPNTPQGSIFWFTLPKSQTIEDCSLQDGEERTARCDRSSSPAVRTSVAQSSFPSGNS